MIQTTNYNPDVLTCLANLSNDEVFTPPNVVNNMLDMLPAELWNNPDAKFLDPACKSGVFLREIAKRLITGLETQIPDKQKRINHIFSKQLYGIAITELTALLSRRSVYCSKTANGKYSICETFTDEQGNIRYERLQHTWQNGKCIYCGASQEVYDRGDEAESYAYNFIHLENPLELFKQKDMKFDVIIGNPPYQLNDGGDKDADKTRGGAIPLYHKFVQQAKKLNPRYLTMIIPSRWFAGGRGLDEFRAEMLNDKRLSVLVDYPIASDIFPGIRLNGGVCYFLWEKEYKGDCKVISCLDGEKDEMVRHLNEYETFVRFNKAIPIVKKVSKEQFEPLSKLVSKQKPFGLRTFERPSGKGKIKLYANKEVGLIEENKITQGHEWLNKWKILLSRGYGEGGEARPYPRMVIGKPIIAPPDSACTETYLVIGRFNSRTQAKNLASYLQTRFVRFLVALKKNTQDVIADRFDFVPIQDFSQEWTDEKLYKKYGLTKDEIAFIESMIRPMENSQNQDLQD
jgi:site-specific DNA-methyltransferase (adenine-specific)